MCKLLYFQQSFMRFLSHI